MLMLPSTVRVYVATGTTDPRRSIDGLSMLVRERLALDPLSGHLFLFRNRRGDRLTILDWDQSGFWVLYKRLERGTFAWPTATDAAPVDMRSTDLLLLLAGTDLTHTRRRREASAERDAIQLQLCSLEYRKRQSGTRIPVGTS